MRVLGKAGERSGEDRLSTHFLSVAIILLCMGGLTFWNNSDLLSSFGAGMNAIMTAPSNASSDNNTGVRNTANENQAEVTWTMDKTKKLLPNEEVTGIQNAPLTVDRSVEAGNHKTVAASPGTSVQAKMNISENQMGSSTEAIDRHVVVAKTASQTEKSNSLRASPNSDSVSVSERVAHGEVDKMQHKTPASKRTPQTVDEETAARVHALISRINAKRNSTSATKSPVKENDVKAKTATTKNETAAATQKETPTTTNSKKPSRVKELIGKLKASASLPEALKPVTSKDCCNGNNRQVCLTEKACNSTLYPLKTPEQVEMLQQYIPTLKAKLRLKNRCIRAKKNLKPPTQWCASNTSNYHYPMGCSMFSMGGGSGPYDRLLLFPEGKLAFCGIPKAGITQWLQFLRFTLGAKDYQSEPYYKEDVFPFLFDKLNPQVQRGIWYNESWTKAILIREPAERLLSAYLDKVKSYRPNQKNTPFGPNVTFAEFVDILSMEDVIMRENDKVFTGLSWFTDPHWRPQAWSCGLSEFVPTFDYIGGFDRAAYHTKALLEQVNLWEPYGKHYRVSERSKKRGNRYCTWPPEPLKPGEVALGFQQQSSHDIDRHSQGSKKKIDQYYTPELLAKVKALYWMDFALWDALQEADKEGNVRGKDIARKLDPKCA